MIVLGITGSIGMGKSTAGDMLRRLRVPVHDSDAAIHALIGPGGKAVKLVEAAFPGSTRAGAVDRRKLGARVFNDEAALRRLEAILHPLARESQQRFLAWARRQRVPVAALSVPLLFETGGDRRCDAVFVLSAPAFLQRQRVLRRPGMTPEKLTGVLLRQMADREKRRRADAVILSGLDKRHTLRRLKTALDRLCAQGTRRRRRARAV